MINETLTTVELNVIDNCNRSCDFCPQSLKTYSPKTHMSLETVERISQQINYYHYKKRISICGFGEPTLHKRINDIIQILRTTECSIEMTTNGDILTEEKVKQYFMDGLDFLSVSIYDKESDTIVSELLPRILEPHQYIIRKRYLNDLIKVNRIEIFDKNIPLNIHKPCNIPSYKLIIDTDGTSLLCTHDWTRKLTFGNINVDSMETIWKNNLHHVRMRLLHGDRNFDPCVKCDIKGDLRGKESVNYFLNSSDSYSNDLKTL